MFMMYPWMVHQLPVTTSKHLSIIVNKYIQEKMYVLSQTSANCLVFINFEEI